jgi:hypothetical protein
MRSSRVVDEEKKWKRGYSHKDGSTELDQWSE